MFIADATTVIAPFQDSAGKWWWAVSGDIVWQIGPAGAGPTIVIPSGFLTDLGSIPAWARFLFNPANPQSARAYVLHDCILSLPGWSQQFAASQLYEAMRHDGVAVWSRVLQAGGVTLAIDDW